ncbi:transporter substrate-binding domain-containing protein [Parendozoicomonas sp. Alg238-R29]|uniref:transporter substrate-binding domain-containing protein n=1 Tax=Parendozoicomonas sp. Alg238-R29 TaxID=2993446 RepID=UPI00248E1D87|nr:transporter substrate-binding domain-containing protein [Parendozoicomonas sp. Alg238-R29]
MNRQGNKLAALRVSVLLPLMLFTTVAASAERIKLATQEWSPYQTSTPSGQVSGIAIDRVRCALATMQQPYQIAFMEWSNAQLNVRRGEFDGFFLASRNEARDKYATLSAPVAQQSWVLYSFQDTASDLFATMDYKENVSIAATFGSGKWFWLMKKGYRVDKYPKDTRRLVDLLLDRKVSAVLETRLVMEEELARRGIKLDIFNQLEIRSSDLGVYFSNTFLQNNPGFLESFNRALSHCRTQKEQP